MSSLDCISWRTEASCTSKFSDSQMLLTLTLTFPSPFTSSATASSFVSSSERKSAPFTAMRATGAGSISSTASALTPPQESSSGSGSASRNADRRIFLLIRTNNPGRDTIARWHPCRGFGLWVELCRPSGQEIPACRRDPVSSAPVSRLTAGRSRRFYPSAAASTTGSSGGGSRVE